jgi:hypothetical protein
MADSPNKSKSDWINFFLPEAEVCIARRRELGDYISDAYGAALAYAGFAAFGMSGTTTRRALLGAAAVALPLAACVIAGPALAATNDAALLAAWAEYQRLQRINYSTRADAWDEAQEADFCRQLDAVEIVIEQSEATTPKGVVAQILLGLMHSESGPDPKAIVADDMTSLRAAYPDLDWTAKLALRAVFNLQKMEG